RKRGYSPEQAQDFTQEFFAGFLEKNYVARATRERGRFRVFLMSSVENFLHNQHDRAQAQKRGGGQKLLSLDCSFCPPPRFWACARSCWLCRKFSTELIKKTRKRPRSRVALAT